jgi:putative ubiquitin-RnfH superfamily antitoxin RatB of RatAB toxin-antitoxin module
MWFSSDSRGFAMVAAASLVMGNLATRAAIEHSALLKQFPDIDLNTQEVGIFGKPTKLTTRDGQIARSDPASRHAMTST